MSIQEKIDKLIKSGDLYFVGDALPSDFYAGFRQWLPLAEAGDIKAMVNVAYCYVRGEGVDRDTTVGWDWYNKAAEVDDPRALVAFYNTYKGVAADKAEGYLQRAVANGDDRAKQIVMERDRERAEATRKAQATAERQEQAKRSASVVAELKGLLERGDNDGARRRAEQAIADGMTWAGSVIAATSLSLNIRRTSRKRYTTIRGASTTTRVVEGVYQTSPVVAGHREYTYKGTVSNPTAYGVHIELIGKNGSIGRYFIPAGGSADVGSSETMESKWPAECRLQLGDPGIPGNTRVKMTLKGGQVTRAGRWTLLKVALAVIVGLWLLPHLVRWIYMLLFLLHGIF